jgi:hypothetical protein
VATNSQPELDQPHKEALMYSKNSPQRRPTAAKLRRLFAISVSSLVLLTRVYVNEGMMWQTWVKTKAHSAWRSYRYGR